jgi:hypothetical protein
MKLHLCLRDESLEIVNTDQIGNLDAEQCASEILHLLWSHVPALSVSMIADALLDELVSQVDIHEALRNVMKKGDVGKKEDSE